MRTLVLVVSVAVLVAVVGVVVLAQPVAADGPLAEVAKAFVDACVAQGLTPVLRQNGDMACEPVALTVPAGPCSQPEASATPPVPVAPVASTTGELCFLFGGRQLDSGTGGHGFEYVATASCDYLARGTGLQPQFSQLVRSDFVDSVGVPVTLEALNDGVQGMVVDGKLYGIPRDAGTGMVPFWSLSWLQYVPPSAQSPDGVLVLCSDDVAEQCAGQRQVLGWNIPLEQMPDHPDFGPWWEALNRTMEDAQAPFNGKIEVVETFQK